MAVVLGRGERLLIRLADEVVVIADDFLPEVRSAGVEDAVVIPNWPVVADLPVLGRANAWSNEHLAAVTSPIFLYAGTLGRKHPPELVAAIAQAVPKWQMVVISEGEGAVRLAEIARERELSNVTQMPFQPHERLGEVLASADVLVAVLSESAGAFSVPSKILSYLCAGRPILAAMPSTNAASKMISADAEAGLVVPPVEHEIARAARILESDADLREKLGANARSYAEAAFIVDDKAALFEAVAAR